jgi:hypothetical protein
MDENNILAIVEERTRLLPDMDRRLRGVAENQAELKTKVDRNCNDIQELDDRVDKLKVLDKVWNGINSLVLAVLIYLQTGKYP